MSKELNLEPLQFTKAELWKILIALELLHQVYPRMQHVGPIIQKIQTYLDGANK